MYKITTDDELVEEPTMVHLWSRRALEGKVMWWIVLHTSVLYYSEGFILSVKID